MPSQTFVLDLSPAVNFLLIVYVLVDFAPRIADTLYRYSPTFRKWSDS